MANKQTIISPVPPDEAGNNEKRCEIRFDCIVKMYDAGYITQAGGFFSLKPPKPYPRQWFRSVSYITLEGIKNSDPYVIGLQIKHQFEELERAIKRYENNGK